uniref:Putative ovule protein n=1 Tax=Solanum chacoense TaxID=4108 RepID=A0A0V0GTE0_SOLCH
MKGWGKASSANWGQSNGDSVPPDSILTKRKRSEETRGGTSSAQWLGKSNTKSWPKRKHNSKYAPKAKWSKMQTGGRGGS